MSASHSAQDMVRPGDAVDLYYYDHQTAKKQCWPTTVNTKYVQQFANLTGGSSVFTIPPNNGIQDIVCSFSFSAIPGAISQLALTRGWGYQLIKQVSFRYGGSTQYFLTGDQILQNALRNQPSREAASDLLLLGGGYAANSDLNSAQFANIVLTLPHNIPSGVGKSHPFPSDCLTQQIQVTVELNPVSSVFCTVGGPSQTAPPTSLATANFQVQQVMLNNAGDALARRVDLAENAYAFPAEFTQQKQIIPLANTADDQSVVLTGFRSGEVKAIHCWLSLRDNTPQPGSVGIQRPWNWYLPNKIEMTYAGDIYARFDNQSSTLWNLINGDKYPGAQVLNVSYSTDFAWQASAFVASWVELPFAQPFVNEDEHNVLVHGKPITNGIVNLVVQTPFASDQWQLNVSYIYNTTILFSQGTCDFVF